jgi:hypothetical protein
MPPLTPFERWLLACGAAFVLSYAGGKLWRHHRGTLDPSEPAIPPETETPEVPVGQDP